MIRWVKFGELAPGTTFKYDGRVYRKLKMNLAEGPDRQQVMFASETKAEVFDPAGEGGRESIARRKGNNENQIN